MELRRWSFVVMTLLLPQTLRASDTKRFVLSWTGRSNIISSCQTLVPLELSSAAMTDLLPASQNSLAPVELDTYVNGVEWTLNQWSLPVSKMLTQSSGTDQSVVMDVQLGDAMNVTILQLVVQADNEPNDVDVSLVFGNNALSGLKELVQVHVVNITTTLENKWLPEGVKLNRLIFDEATVENLELETSVTIQHVVIRHCNLSFPTAVLELDTAVKSLILEHNTIAGPIVLTKNEYAQLLNISDFKATANTIDPLGSGSTSCVKEETIGGLTICIVEDVQSTGSSLSNGNATGSLETESVNTTSTRAASSVTAMMLVSACALALVVVLSFFHRFKRKTSKFFDERLTFSHREDGLLIGGEVETGSQLAATGDAKILADMDLGKDQVTLHKKLGVQSMWLGVYKQTNVVALKFVPRELHMSIKELNAVRMSYVPFRHDNIVRFLGSSWTDREEVLIVVEHMSMGSLRSVLADEKIDLSWPKRLQMSKDICSGLNFVRSIQGIKLSRNLTANSVLLDAQFICKLDIFDYASSLRTELVPARSFGNGDIASRAPELLKGDKITAAAEVYALGVIFCEISSRSKLFQCVSEESGPTMADIFIATEVIARRLEPLPAGDAPADFQELALRCLRYEPSERPKLSEIFSMILKYSI
ncbi:unnamed protein product [Peronospora destructor]|uniref:Protein kinase domain-containing protein n=1 Tax=Peronospora destructor TaxID=86335 RepID=A0AAV0TXB1_9STRA|nr:unnamed protein product [Peronospora destructor]